MNQLVQIRNCNGTFRSKIKNLKKNINLQDKKIAEVKIFDFIKTWSLFKNSQNIAIYHSTPEELDTTNIIKEILTLEKNCYLPIINKNNNYFEFYKYSPNIKLIPNKYKILEPEVILKNKINIEKLDIIFIPMVAFTSSRKRLGMGGGYYDKTLKSLLIHKQNSNTSNPILIGLAFEFQKLDFIPFEPWDINLDIIVTENNIY